MVDGMVDGNAFDVGVLDVAVAVAVLYDGVFGTLSMSSTLFNDTPVDTVDNVRYLNAL
jgi:hypothetical protein